MTIKQVRIAINPSNTYAILTITDEFGVEHELIADPEQIHYMHRVLQYTTTRLDTVPTSTSEAVGVLH